MDIEEAIRKEFHAELIPEENLKEESFMKKNGKRIAAVVISLVTLLLIAVPAFAYNRVSDKSIYSYVVGGVHEIHEDYTCNCEYGLYIDDGDEDNGIGSRIDINATDNLKKFLDKGDFSGDSTSIITDKNHRALYYYNSDSDLAYSIKNDTTKKVGKGKYFFTKKNSPSAKHIKPSKLKNHTIYYLWIEKKSTLSLKPMWSYTWYGKSKISFISKKETSKYTRYKFKTKRKGTLDCELYDNYETGVFYDDFYIHIR